MSIRQQLACFGIVTKVMSTIVGLSILGAVLLAANVAAAAIWLGCLLDWDLSIMACFVPALVMFIDVCVSLLISRFWPGFSNWVCHGLSKQ